MVQKMAFGVAGRFMQMAVAGLRVGVGMACFHVRPIATVVICGGAAIDHEAFSARRTPRCPGM